MDTWNYAQLSHIAKQMGGPEKLVQIISQHGMQKGLKLPASSDRLLRFAQICGCATLQRNLQKILASQLSGALRRGRFVSTTEAAADLSMLKSLFRACSLKCLLALRQVIILSTLLLTLTARLAMRPRWR